MVPPDPPADVETAKTAAETAKAHLDALNTILIFPLPILIVVGAAIAAEKPSVTLGGIDLDLPLANLAALAITGFAVLTAGRHAAVINAMCRKAAGSALVRDTIEGHAGALNPFFRLDYDPRSDWMERRLSDLLHGVPKVSVGLIIGFVWIFHPTLPSAPIMQRSEFIWAAVGAAALFVGGWFSILAMISIVLARLGRNLAIAILLTGVALGAWFGYHAAAVLSAKPREVQSITPGLPTGSIRSTPPAARPD